MKTYVQSVFLQNPSTLPGQGTVGQPISSIFNIYILYSIWDVISLFRTMESDPDVIAQGLLQPIEVSGPLYDAFKVANSAAFLNTPIWYNGMSGAASDINFEVTTAKRRYKLQAPNAESLYMEVHVGMMGIGANPNSFNVVSRPYVKLIISADEAFTAVIGEHNFAVKTASNNNVNGRNYGANAKLRYILHNGTLAVYTHALPISTPSHHALGKQSGYSAPFLIPVGFVISSGDYYAPLSASGKTVFVLCSPSYERDSNNTVDTASDSLTQLGFSAAKCKGASIFTNVYAEKRGLFSPSVSGGAIGSDYPARSYIAPFTHVFSNGTILACPDLVFLSDPDRSKMDFVSTTLLYNGEPTAVSVLPMMVSHPTVNEEWQASSNSFQLGIKV